MIKIALVDDHKLFRKSLADWLATQQFEILFEANNGKEFIDNIDKNMLPQLVLMDINMPIMNGVETLLWITKNCPSIKVLAISMYNDEMNIIRMIRLGASGYLLKDSEPNELKLAIETIVDKGFYYSDLVNQKLLSAISEANSKQRVITQLIELSLRETEFLKYVCTELTYKEIADKMTLSPRTVDGYREELFRKLNVTTRIGLVLYAIKVGIVDPS